MTDETLEAPQEAPELLLLYAIAQALNDRQGPREAVVWHEDDSVPYDDDQVGVYIDQWPEVPGGSVAIADYSVSDAGTLSDSVVGVQFTIRHPDLAAVKRITADVFDLFHGLPRCTMGGTTVVSAERRSGTSQVGQDSNNRRGRVENYYFTVHRPSPNRQ